MRTDGILFDLDGTLWDAVEGICRGWNDGFVECGLEPRLTVPQLRACMGLLMEDIAARILPEIRDPAARMAVMEVCYRHQLAYLAERGGTLYPGVEETLAARAERFPLCIVSNCQDGYIQDFLDFADMRGLFGDFESAGGTGLSKGENIKLVIERNSIDKAVYVGDTQGDLDSADFAGIPFIRAAYGFGQMNRPVPEIREFCELPEKAAEII